MKVFCVHPGPLMYTKVFLRPEPLGLELVAESLRRAGHDIRLMDLQVESHADFLRELDTCASIEFSRGCPWDCSFCSAWTFYGRSYRVMSTERIMDDLRRIKEAGIFIVDDVAFIQAQHGMEIGEAIAREGIRKHTTWRPGATSCCATRKSSSSGKDWTWNICSSVSKPSTPKGCRNSASASAWARTSRPWSSPGP
jgi:biotin synthase-like enzyme